MSILEAIKNAGPMSLPAPGPVPWGTNAPMMVVPKQAAKPSQSPALSASGTSAPESAAPKRITMWNKRENRKISGNAAPMEKNIDEYLRKHPECEVYNGQRSQMDPAVRAAQLAAEPRITIWNKSERRKVSGNAAPLEKNINEYLRKHPDCEIYDGQDKRAPGAPSPAMMARMAPGGPLAMNPGMMQAQMRQAQMIVPGTMHVPRIPDAKDPYGWESPKCTLDFLAMIACQENLSLLNADAYHSEHEEEEAPVVRAEVRAEVMVGEKRGLETSAIDQLLKRVKAA